MRIVATNPATSHTQDTWDRFNKKRKAISRILKKSKTFKGFDESFRDAVQEANIIDRSKA